MIAAFSKSRVKQISMACALAALGLNLLRSADLLQTLTGSVLAAQSLLYDLAAKHCSCTGS